MKRNITVLISLISILGVACAPNMKQLMESGRYKSRAENSISTAKEKIKIAKEKGAERYSEDNLNFAVFSLEEAEKCYGVGVLNHKKSYKTANENYIKAIEYGDSAVDFADLAIEISETSEILRGAEEAIEEAKEAEAWVYAFQKVNNAAAFLDQAWQSFRLGKYAEAREFSQKAIKSANDAKEEAEVKKGNLEERLKRFEKAKNKLTDQLLSNKNDLDNIIKDVKEMLSAEIDLLGYKIDVSEEEAEKINLKQSLAGLKMTESKILALIGEYYRASKEYDDAKQKVEKAREERDMLGKELVKLRAKAGVVIDELNDLIRKRDGLIER
ncbi:MAG: hypothetical protein ABII25_00960 [bacterium]